MNLLYSKVKTIKLSNYKISCFFLSMHDQLETRVQSFTALYGNSFDYSVCKLCSRLKTSLQTIAKFTHVLIKYKKNTFALM